MKRQTLPKVGFIAFAIAATEMPSPGAELVHGMFYTPEGEAKLNVNGQGQLLVSGFGSNGLDGFSVDVSNSQGWSGQFGPGAFATNGFTVGKLFDVNDQLLSEQRFQFINGRWFGSALFPTGPAQIMDGEIQVSRVVTYDGRVREKTEWVMASGVMLDFTAYVPPDPCENPPPCRYEQLSDALCVRYCYPCGGTATVEVVLCLRPIAPRPNPNPVRRYTLLGASLTGMVFQSSAMRMFDHDNTGLGQATLLAREGLLTVGNIGSTGLDGILIGLSQPASAFSMEWAALDSNTTAGAQLQLSAEGGEFGAPIASLGDLTFRHDGQRVEIRPDFKALSNAGYHGQIRHKGQIIHTFQGLHGAIAAFANRWPSRTSFQMGSGSSASAGWSESIAFTTPSNQQIAGDEIWVEPLNPTSPYRVVRDVRVRARDILEIPIINHFSFVPTLICPANLIIECLDPRGTVVADYDVRPSNFCSTPTITCMPPAGSAFHPGETRVNCQAVDSCGQRAECSFSVFVRDTTPPYIRCPSNIVTMSLFSTGTVVHFRPTVHDSCDASPTVVCKPPSGSAFHIGTTPVTCVATDDDGNSASCQFEVTISPAATMSAVLPPFGRAGDFIMIEGEGFPPNANDLSVMLPMGNTLIPLRVVDVTEKRIVARLGPVPPDAVAGPLVIAQGTGIQNGETWAFRRPPGPGIPAPGPFEPVYLAPAGSDRDFFSGPPQNGVLVLTLDGTWPSNTTFSIFCSMGSVSAGVHLEIDSPNLSFPGASTTLDFATRIAEAIKSAAQLIGEEVIAISEEAGQTKAKITLSFENASIDSGQVVVCPSVQNPLMLTRAFPGKAAEGDLLTIDGSGFGDDPLDLFVAVKENNSPRMAALQVLQVEDSTILAKMGPMPPNFAGGPIVLMKGEGYRLSPETLTQFNALEPAWFWRGYLPRTWPIGLHPRMDPPPPPPGATCFYAWADGTRVVRLVLEGVCRPGAVVTVQSTLFDPFGSAAYPMGRGSMSFRASTETPEQCAERIAEMIRSMQRDLEGIDVNPRPDGTVEIVLRGLSIIRWTEGYVRVCVREEPPALGPIVVFPDPFRPGSIVTITGKGFGEDPSAIGLAIREDNGQRLLPLRVLSASDTWMTARVGAIPPDMNSGTLIFTRGYGSASQFRPTLPGVQLLDDVQVWRPSYGVPLALQKVDFNSSPLPPGELRFFSGPPNQNGALELLMEGDWPSNSTISIEIATREIGSTIGQVVLNAPSLQIIGEDGILGEDTLQARVLAIANFIRSALWQQVLVLVDTKVEPIDSDTMKLIVSLPKGRFVEGILIAGILPPLPDVTIGQITPMSARAGDLITLTGSGFGTNTNNVMVAVRDTKAHGLIPIHVQQVSDTTLVGRLGPVPSNAVPGPIVVALGEGTQGKIRPLWGDMPVLNDVIVWEGDNAAICQSAVQLTPVHSIPPLTTRCFHSEPDPVDPFRSLCLILDGECPTRVAIGVECNVIDLEGPTPGVSASGVVWTSFTNTLMHCAWVIAELIRRSIAERQGNAAIVEVVPLPDGRIKISIRPHWTLRGGRLEGSITVCYYASGVVPVFASARFLANEIVLQFPTAAGLRYTLLFRPNLDPQSNWIPIATIIGDGTEQSFKHGMNPQSSQGFFQMRVE